MQFKINMSHVGFSVNWPLNMTTWIPALNFSFILVVFFFLNKVVNFFFFFLFCPNHPTIKPNINPVLLFPPIFLAVSLSPLSSFWWTHRAQLVVVYNYGTHQVLFLNSVRATRHNIKWWRCGLISNWVWCLLISSPNFKRLSSIAIPEIKSHKKPNNPIGHGKAPAWRPRRVQPKDCRGGSELCASLLVPSSVVMEDSSNVKNMSCGTRSILNTGFGADVPILDKEEQCPRQPHFTFLSNQRRCLVFISNLFSFSLSNWAVSLQKNKKKKQMRADVLRADNIKMLV